MLNNHVFFLETCHLRQGVHCPRTKLFTKQRSAYTHLLKDVRDKTRDLN